MICYFTLIFQSFNDISLCIKIVDHCFNDDNVEGTWSRPSCRSGDRLVTVSVKRMLIICPSWMTSCGLTFWTHSYWHARWIWRQLLRLFIKYLFKLVVKIPSLLNPGKMTDAVYSPKPLMRPHPVSLQSAPRNSSPLFAIGTTSAYSSERSTGVANWIRATSFWMKFAFISKLACCKEKGTIYNIPMKYM